MQQKADDPLATELKESLKAYLQTDAFSNSVKDARTTQARVPLLYLRYVKGDFYTDEVVLQFKKYLNMIDGVIEDGKIKDSLLPLRAQARKAGTACSTSFTVGVR